MKAPGWFLLSAVVFSGCGYSQDEWDQKVRENEELRAQLASEQRARTKSESDYADALEEIDALRNQVMEGGLNLDSMNADLEAQKKALEEYAQRTAQLQHIRERFEVLRSKLAQLTKLGLTLEVRGNRMLIQLPGDVLFESGRDELKKEGGAILLRLAEVIRGDIDLKKRHFQVAGHTDDKPFAGGAFRDNWGLSAMRARAVLVLLTTGTDKKGGGLDPRHWSAAGYGSTDPVASNASEEGRSKNRRVELVAQPDVSEMINLGSINQPEAGTDEP